LKRIKNIDNLLSKAHSRFLIVAAFPLSLFRAQEGQRAYHLYSITRR
jgi:hypothetical protein